MTDDASTATAMAPPANPAVNSPEHSASAVEAAASGLQDSPANATKPTSLQDLDVVGSIEQELEQVSAIYQMVVEFFVGYSFQIIGALIIMLLGTLVARKISSMIERFCLSKKLDVTLSNFIGSTVKIIIVIMIAIIASEYGPNKN